MKAKAALGFGIFLSSMALAAPPNYPDAVHGHLLEGLTKRTPFSFTPPTTSECTASVIGTFTAYQCKPAGGELVIAGNSHQVVFDRVSVFFGQGRDKQTVRRFIFLGSVTESGTDPALTSKLDLELVTEGEAPKQYTGYLKYSDYGVGSALIAPKN